MVWDPLSFCFRINYTRDFALAGNRLPPSPNMAWSAPRDFAAFKANPLPPVIYPLTSNVAKVVARSFVSINRNVFVIHILNTKHFASHQYRKMRHKVF